MAFTNMLGQRLKCASASLRTKVYQVLDGLFSLEATRLEFVHGRVHDLTIHALNFAVLHQIDLHVVALGQELTNQLEDVHD